MAFDTHELAWAGGFFCGEGSMWWPKSRTTHLTPHITMGQRDREVLDRFCAAVGVGKVRGPYGPYTGNNKCVMYHFTCSTHWECQHVTAVLWRWLSTEKRNQCHRVLSESLRVRSMPQRRNKAALARIRR